MLKAALNKNLQVDLVCSIRRLRAQGQGQHVLLKWSALLHDSLLRVFGTVVEDLTLLPKGEFQMRLRDPPLYVN